MNVISIHCQKHARIDNPIALFHVGLGWVGALGEGLSVTSFDVRVALTNVFSVHDPGDKVLQGTIC